MRNNNRKCYMKKKCSNTETCEKTYFKRLRTNEILIDTINMSKEHI